VADAAQPWNEPHQALARAIRHLGPSLADVAGRSRHQGHEHHGGPTPSRRYERHRPEQTPLHRVVSERLESWLQWRDRFERGVTALASGNVGKREKARMASPA
jgi:hypothetical protein